MLENILQYRRARIETDRETRDAYQILVRKPKWKTRVGEHWCAWGESIERGL
jgi:hypothetical protein